MIDVIVAQDKATSLNQAARKLNIALLALESYDLRHAGEPLDAEAQKDRNALVHVAADVLWQFVVQREACGIVDLEHIMREYRIPAEVRSRMGASPL